jgi:hypothetical protein
MVKGGQLGVAGSWEWRAGRCAVVAVPGILAAVYSSSSNNNIQGDFQHSKDAGSTHLDAILGCHLLQLISIVVLAHAAQVSSGTWHLRQERQGPRGRTCERVMVRG